MVCNYRCEEYYRSFVIYLTVWRGRVYRLQQVHTDGWPP